MKNNFTISQRNAIVENHLWCIKAVMKQNRALIRANRSCRPQAKFRRPTLCFWMRSSNAMTAF